MVEVALAAAGHGRPRRSRSAPASAAGGEVAVIESMKMEHAVDAPEAGTVDDGAAWRPATSCRRAIVLAVAAPREARRGRVDDGRPAVAGERADLAEVRARHAIGLDAARPDAVERRRRTGQRTARENVDDLLDPGSFVEYGPLVIAAQRRRRELQDLIERTPADGLVGGRRHGGRPPGRGDVLRLHRAGRHPGPAEPPQEGPPLRGGRAPAAAGGVLHRGRRRPAGRHRRHRCVRPRLPGLQPLRPAVGPRAAGRASPAGAASPATPRCSGCCDVVIATEGSNIGMGGPAMVEGGGLGVFPPEAIGPMDVQVPNGVVDVAVADEAAAVAVAQQYLVLLPGIRRRRGPRPDPDGGPRAWSRRTGCRCTTCAPPSTPSPTSARVLELRPAFGLGMVTALARVEGRPMGVVANNPMHLAGAIDADGADKAARFLQLCDAFDLPVLFLCDTPGIMVGPEAEQTALVRHVSRLFVTGANVTVPDRHDHPAQGLRPGRPGHGRRQLQGAAVLRRLAHRRVRRHGPRGSRAARLPQGARGHRRRRASGSAPSRRWSTACTRTARPSTRPATSRSTTSSTPPTPAAGSATAFGVGAGAGAAAGKKRPNIDTW